MNQDSFPSFYIPATLIDRELDALVIGTSGWEVTVQIPCWPINGKQENIAILRSSSTAGGCGTNVAVFMGRLGGKVSLITRLGDDKNSQSVFDELNKSNVRTEYINRISEINVNFNIIITDQKGDWAVLTNIAPELTLSEIDIPNELIFHKAKFFHVDGFLCRTLKEIDAIFSAIDLAHSQGSLVSVDCAVPVARENPDFLRKLFKKCDIFLANEEEARAVTGEVTTAEIICVLQKVGPSLSVLKVGQNGSYYITSQGVGHIPAYDVDIVDTVAAGDALLGTLLWCLSHGFTLYEAAIRGSAAASLACLGMGSLSSHFGLKEIENLIAHGSKKKEINKHE